jgi:hypothetical protein
MFGYKLHQEAFVIRGKVLNDDEGKIAVGRHVIEELVNGFEATGRRAYGYDIAFGGRQ